MRAHSISFLLLHLIFLLQAIAREKMSHSRGADAEDAGAMGSNLKLLPEIKDASARAAAAAAAAAPAGDCKAAAAANGKTPAAASAAAAGGAASDDDSDEELPLGRRFGRGRRASRGGRGVTVGHATNDTTPDLRLGELERLFAV
jgi:hypothetical protein